MKYKEIILASSSPRRIEVMKSARIPFRSIPSEYHEDMNRDLSAEDLAMFLARGKAKEVSQRHKGCVVIGADTFIVHNKRKLGKPKNAQEARELLHSLSGQCVEVISGVCIIHEEPGYDVAFHDRSRIYMREIPEELIEKYIDTKIPFDRAGGFGIQDIGGRFIKKIEGDYNSILGLPLFKILTELYRIDENLISIDFA